MTTHKNLIGQTTKVPASVDAMQPEITIVDIERREDGTFDVTGALYGATGYWNLKAHELPAPIATA